MYKTDIYKKNTLLKGIEGSDYFDWEAFFSREAAENIIKQIDLDQVVFRAREHLKENKFRLTLALNHVMRKLLKDKEPHQTRILELGAATGFLTRWLIEEFNGTGVLVDNSEASYQAYNTMNYDLKHHITYIKADLFQLEIEEKFPLVCSFGLIEHFRDKKAVIEAHKRFVTPGGIIIIIVPMDTPLTRVFFELHPELDRGYRELLKERELKDILTQHGLKILRTQGSSGYSYDFLAALCFL